MKRKGLFCDSCDFIFDQKWHNLSLSDLVLAVCYALEIVEIADFLPLLIQSYK